MQCLETRVIGSQCCGEAVLGDEEVNEEAGCLLLRFAVDGRCQDLWEYWQVQPGRQAPPAGWGA